MDLAIPILVIALVVVAMVVVFYVTFYVTGRAWRSRHACDEDFWRRGGW